MKYKYQIILLGSDVLEKTNVLSKVNEKIKDLELPNSIIKFIEADKLSSDYQGNQPAFALYFGDSEGNHKHLDITDKLLKDGTMILPIYFGNPDEGAFSKEIPYILSNQNGIRYNDNELDRIANIILEAFELLRITRKIFISYH